MASENKTTGGNLSMDYNLRTKLGFPDGKLNIDESTEELTANSLLRHIIEILEILYNQYFIRLSDSERKSLNLQILKDKIDVLELYARY